MCHHTICDIIYAECGKKCRGCAVIPFIKHDGIMEAILGYEDGSTYGYTYRHEPIRICTGKLDACDAGCFIACTVRELSEEYKIKIESDSFVDRLFHMAIINRCPVFTLEITDTSKGAMGTYEVIKARVAEDRKKTDLPKCQREISETYLIPSDVFNTTRKPALYSALAWDALAFAFYNIKPRWHTIDINPREYRPLENRIPLR